MNVFITGGAGFIGSNIAEFHLKRRDTVTVFDDLSRKASRVNIEWLKKQGPVKFIEKDIVNAEDIKQALADAGGVDIIYHMAAQVAVTSSVASPRHDFYANALGTFNLLEAVRSLRIDPVLIYASTNKVYGEMTDMRIEEKPLRYEYRGVPEGISESRALDFHSPYGCSKGCADQYVIDYSRIYGMRTVCFRQSCIYGPRQFGEEDQGWVAWFIIAAITGRPVTVYGDGKQVRDILHVRDLINLYQAAYENIDKVKGQAFNTGGGPDNTLSILELIGYIKSRSGGEFEYSFADWRPGDQKIYVSDIAKSRAVLDWSPGTGKNAGLDTLWEWVAANKDIFI